MYLMSPLFCEKGGILFKGGHYLKKYGMYYFIEDLDKKNHLKIDRPVYYANPISMRHFFCIAIRQGPLSNWTEHSIFPYPLYQGKISTEKPDIFWQICMCWSPWANSPQPIQSPNFSILTAGPLEKQNILGTICPGGPNWLGTICPWDQILGDHLSMGTELFEDSLSRGTNQLGTHLGDQMSGNHMRLGPNVSQPNFEGMMVQVTHGPISIIQ